MVTLAALSLSILMLVENREAVFEALERGGGERGQRQGQAGHMQLWPGDTCEGIQTNLMTNDRS